MSKIVNKISVDEFAYFKAGDAKAFRRIFDAYYRLIYNYAYKFCKIHEEAEELVQEVFVSLFLNRHKIENCEGVYPYLFVMTKRLTISTFRRKVVESKFDDYLKHNWNEGYNLTDHTLASKELGGLWTAAMETLPQKQKEVYALNKLEGLSYQEIAERIGVSKNTVKNQLITASKTVKLILKNVYYLILFLKIFF